MEDSKDLISRQAAQSFSCGQENDLISRKEAIDALGEEPYVWEEDDDYARGMRYQWKIDHDAIEAVPSVQPERPKGKEGKE